MLLDNNDMVGQAKGIAPRVLHWLGLVLILETGLIHYLTAMTEFQEAEYMGYLFVANFLCALLAAYGIYRKQVWGWLLGAGVAGASIAGYIWSRTIGMPGMPLEEWFTPYGVVALAVEGLFLLLAVLRPWRRARSEASELSGAPGFILQPAAVPDSLAKSRLRSRAWTAAGLLALVLISYPAYRWDAYVASQIGQHEHVGSLAQVCSTPITSVEALRENYGIEVALVASTAMDSFVDVRLKIIDAKKANNLLVNQAAILVGQQELLLAPHIHSHAKPKDGKLVVIFFPNRDKSIHTGTEVSLVFGKTRIAPISVR
jgi:hypothetical protein